MPSDWPTKPSSYSSSRCGRTASAVSLMAVGMMALLSDAWIVGVDAGPVARLEPLAGVAVGLVTAFEPLESALLRADRAEHVFAVEIGVDDGPPVAGLVVDVVVLLHGPAAVAGEAAVVDPPVVGESLDRDRSVDD